MLAPNLLDLETDLNALGWAIAGLDGIGSSFSLAKLTQLEPALPWITTAQHSFAQGAEANTAWLDARIAVITQLTDSFVSYAELIDALAGTVSPNDTSPVWVDRLSQLQEQASANDVATSKSALALTRARQAFDAVHRQLQQVGEEARGGLQSINDDMLRASVRLQALRATLTSFGLASGAASQSTGRTVVTSTATIVYTALIAGNAAMPYGAIATTVFSIGQLAWNVIVTDPAVAAALKEVEADMNILKSDQRAYVLTNHLLDQLESLNSIFDQSIGNAPRLNEYWKAQVAELGVLINALKAGTPGAGLTDLSAFQPAAVTWQTLARIAGESFQGGVGLTATLYCGLSS